VISHWTLHLSCGALPAPGFKKGLKHLYALAFLVILLPSVSLAHLGSEGTTGERLQAPGDAGRDSRATRQDWSSRVQALIAQTQLSKAEKMIVARMMTRPRDAELITLLAEVRLDQGRWPEALTLLKGADALGGVSALRAVLMGLAESAQGRLDFAEPDFRKAIRLLPHYVAAHYFLARLLYTQNHFDESIRESEQTITLSPCFVRAYENLGLCYQGKLQLQEAKRSYLDAIRCESEGGMRTEWPMLDLATMLIKDNQIPDTRKYLLQALAINPNNSQAVYEMGVLLEQTGDLRGALEEFKRATQLAPRSANAYYRMARIYGRLGYKSEERKDFALFRQISEANHSPRAPIPIGMDPLP
jgi:tetratricopeptide (TPR) repeat protein